MSDETCEYLSEILQYLENPNFECAIVTKDTRYFRGHNGLFFKYIRQLKDAGLSLTFTKQPMVINISSGATLRFLNEEGCRGRLLNAAIILKTKDLTQQEISLIKTRIRVPCNPNGSLYLKGI